MTRKFVATVITHTKNTDDAKRLEVTFADPSGQLHTLSVPAAIASSLAAVLHDFSLASRTAGAIPTKLPKEFAVGAGRYEPMVLVRFEDDAPYGLEAEQAEALARALAEQATLVATVPMALRQ